MENVLQTLPLVALVITLSSLALTLALGGILAYHLVRYALAPAP